MNIEIRYPRQFIIPCGLLTVPENRVFIRLRGNTLGQIFIWVIDLVASKEDK